MQNAIRLGSNTLIVALEPPMRFTQNSLPLSVTQNDDTWADEILADNSAG